MSTRFTLTTLACCALLACSSNNTNNTSPGTGETAGSGASGTMGGGAGASSAATGGSRASTGTGGSGGSVHSTGGTSAAGAMASATGGSSAGGSGGSAASAGEGASGTAGGAGTSAPAKPPFMPTGEVIPNSGANFTWVDFPDTHCRDGMSTAGLSISFGSATDKLAIYLEGGGACFDASTCGSNPASVISQTPPGSSGIFDRSNAANPIKDWTIVYVPYCTGDVHIGANPNGQVDGVTGTQMFVGRTNLQSFLNRLVPTFPNLSQVLLTGASAGGFGASANAEFVQWAFGSIPVTMIDDSGPTFSSQYLPICINMKYRKYWGLDNTILADCGDDCPNKDDFSIDYLKHVAKMAGGRLAGLIESSQDATIRQFYGIATDGGKNDCMGDLIFGQAMDANLFTMGLLDFRMTVQSVYPNYGTYYPNSTQHTWIGGDTFYTQADMTTGTKMVDWFNDILTGKQAAQVGP